jgi:DNA (cytosine-5)-methyltransferase 1
MSAVLKSSAEAFVQSDREVLRNLQPAPSVSINEAAPSANDKQFAAVANKSGIVEQPKIEIVFGGNEPRADARLWVHPVGHRQYAAGFAFAFRIGHFKNHMRAVFADGKTFPSVAKAIEHGVAELNSTLDRKFSGLVERVADEIWQEKAIRLWAADAVAKAAAGEFDEKPTFTFADICAGMGGVHLGLEMAGGKCVLVSEIDQAALSTLEANGYLQDVVVNTDVTQIVPETLPDFDVLFGGFPCQPYSIAGLKQAFSDKRSDPLAAIIKMAEVKQPKVVVLENVLNLASGDNGAWLRSIQIALANLGYIVDSECFNAADFGLPQQRKRIYITAHRRDAGAFFQSFIAPKGAGCTKSVRDVLESDAPDGHHDIADMVQMPTKSKKSPFRRLGQMHGNMGQHARVYDPSGQAATLMASQQNCGLYLVNGHPRALTPRERARLQGFPDTFLLHCTKTVANKQIGNSVAVPVVAAIGRAIVQQFFSQPAA